MPSTPAGESDKYRAPALDKGLDILELLATRDGSMSQVEIAKALGRSAGEIFRMLDRLVRRGYVLRTGEDRYTLGLKLFEMAHATPPLRRLMAAAMPVMQEFSQTVRQACHLVSRDRDRLVVVAKVDAPGYWSLAIQVGARVDLLETGSGHVFLANADPVERAQMLRGQETTPELERRLEKIRADGFVSMPSRQIASVTNLAVPVRGAFGSVLAALSCPFIERLDEANTLDCDAALERLKIAAGQLSAEP